MFALAFGKTSFAAQRQLVALRAARWIGGGADAALHVVV